MGQRSIDRLDRAAARTATVDGRSGQFVERLAQLDRGREVGNAWALTRRQADCREPVGQPLRRVEPLDHRTATPPGERGNEIQPGRAVVEAEFGVVHKPQCNDLTRYDKPCSL